MKGHKLDIEVFKKNRMLFRHEMRLFEPKKYVDGFIAGFDLALMCLLDTELYEERAGLNHRKINVVFDDEHEKHFQEL